MKKREGAWLLLPLYLWTLMLVALPMGYVLVLSLLTRGEQYGVQFIPTLSAFARLTDSANVAIFLRSMRVAMLTTLASLAIGYPFAYAMARRPKKSRNFFLLMVIVPFWTSALLRTYGWMIFLRSNGLLNAWLTQLGLISDPIKFLYNDGAILFGMVYSFLPFMILPVYTSLEKLDRSLNEAARDLGAHPFRAFWTITFPLTVPGLVSGCVMTFVPSIGLFFISDLMGGGKSMLLGNLISHYLHAGRDWPLGAALSMVLVLLTFITLGLYRRFSDGGDLGVF